jgi:hypothetical protein
MDTLTIRDILISQNQTIPLSDPVEYTDNDLQEFGTNVEQLDQSHFKLTTTISGDIIFDIDDEDSSHLRHDFIASASWGGTDQSLDELGISSSLTPDCIIKDEKKVLELASSFIDAKPVLDGAYLRKRVAYESILEQHAIKYFILIVGPKRIITNCNLAPAMVSKLCQRCRCGMSLVAQIEKLTGRVIQDSNKERSKSNSRTRKAMESLSSIKKSGNSSFNLQLMDLLSPKVSPEDEEWVKLLVSKSLSKASEQSRENRRMNSSEKVSRAYQHYKSSHELRGTRKSKKRVSIFPMIVTNQMKWDGRRALKEIGENISTPYSLMKVWEGYNQSLLWFDQKNYPQIQRESKTQALWDENPERRHILRNRSVINPKLNKADLDHIALSGPGAKLRSEMTEIKEHESESKLSFSLDSDTSDIEQFINSDILTQYLDPDHLEDHILEAIIKSKNEVHPNAESGMVFQKLRNSSLAQHAALISEICLELSYEYKTPHRSNQWGLKLLKNFPVMLLFRSTGTHVFFSLALSKDKSSLLDTGRLGPEVYETANYYITDFSSISEDGLEHFIKALPYSMTLMSSLHQILKLPLPEKNTRQPEMYWQCLKSVYLIYLNNKLDCEEAITSLRYFYMNLFQESYRDLSLYVDRLPEVLRSRLTVYFVKRTKNLLDHYSMQGLKRIRLRDKKGKPTYSVRPVKNVFCNSLFDGSMLVNSFYFAYVVSKSRGKIGDRNVKVVSKILTEEFWYLENIVGKNIILWDRRDEPLKHCWDPTFLNYIVTHHINQMNKVYGGGFLQILEQDVLQSFHKASFLEVATLKASSHEEEFNFYIPDPKEFKTY